jgi:AcrR family transcriptional regulator
MQSYQDIRDQSQDLLRRNVIRVAEHLLETQGAEAVTVRRVAQQLTCSTTVLYNLFGSKDGLSNALYLEGCHLMHAALAAVANDDDPQRYLAALAWAYWDFAFQYPHYYTLMFSGALPEFKPEPANLHDVTTAIGLVVAVLERYRQQGVLEIDDPVQIATQIWIALHGVIHLFFAGHLGQREAAKVMYTRMITTMIQALTIVRP